MNTVSNKTKYYLNGKRPNVITDSYAKRKINMSSKNITRIDVCYIKDEEYTGPFGEGSIMNSNYSGVEKCKSFHTSNDAIDFCDKIIEKRKIANSKILTYTFTQVVLNKKIFGMTELPLSLSRWFDKTLLPQNIDLAFSRTY